MTQDLKIRTAPRPKKDVRVRVEGPFIVNGMKVWRVLRVPEMEQVGPHCFSMEEVRSRIRDVITGKQVIWMGHTRMTPKPL